MLLTLKKIENTLTISFKWKPLNFYFKNTFELLNNFINTLKLITNSEIFSLI